jgi:predicted acyltransferase
MNRLKSLDVMRGLTVALMILVNNGGEHNYSFLEHSKWNGLTPCDLVFPFFLFMMGMSTFLSLKKTEFKPSAAIYRKIAKRTVLLFLIGLGINWFDMICNGGGLDFAHLRIWAVLQRIALCYGVVAMLAITLETTYDEALQIKLGSDTHIHILVECVEVGDEWAGRSTTGNALQGRSLYLCIASVVEYAAQSAQYGSTLQEGILHAIVYDEVNIALTVTQLRIVELVVSYTILVLHDWEWLQALGEQAQLLGVNRNLASLCTENETLYADEVTDVEELLEYSIIKVLELIIVSKSLDAIFDIIRDILLLLLILMRPFHALHRIIGNSAGRFRLLGTRQRHRTHISLLSLHDGNVHLSISEED